MVMMREEGKLPGSRTWNEWKNWWVGERGKAGRNHASAGSDRRRRSDDETDPC